MFLKLFFILVAAFSVAQGVDVQCRNDSVYPVRDFDIGRYSGKEWYIILYAAGNNTEIVQDTKCESESFASTETPNVYRLNANAVMIEDNSNITASLHVTTNTNNTAVMYTDYDGRDSTSILLATDYESWSLWYRCAVGADKNTEIAVVRSRARTLDPSVLSFLRDYVSGLGFPEHNIRLEDQTGC